MSILTKFKSLSERRARRQTFPKANFKMFVTALEEVIDEEDSEKKSYKVKDTEIFSYSGRKFFDEILEDEENGIKHEIEIVDEKPENFVVNKLYMLRTRDKIWTWVVVND